MDNMKKIPDTEYYFYSHRNKDGYVISLSRVLFGYRVVVYHEHDNVTVGMSLCGGDKIKSIMLLYKSVYDWLNTNPEDVYDMCNYLSTQETSRPYGNSTELIKALENLPRKTSSRAFSSIETAIIKNIHEL